jgi:hypothetical protein
MATLTGEKVNDVGCVVCDWFGCGLERLLCASCLSVKEIVCVNRRLPEK